MTGGKVNILGGNGRWEGTKPWRTTNNNKHNLKARLKPCKKGRGLGDKQGGEWEREQRHGENKKAGREGLRQRMSRAAGV